MHVYVSYSLTTRCLGLLSMRVCYLGCLVDANCIIQVDVLRADEFTVSL